MYKVKLLQLVHTVPDQCVLNTQGFVAGDANVGAWEKVVVEGHISA